MHEKSLRKKLWGFERINFFGKKTKNSIKISLKKWKISNNNLYSVASKIYNKKYTVNPAPIIFPRCCACISSNL